MNSLLIDTGSCCLFIRELDLRRLLQEIKPVSYCSFLAGKLRERDTKICKFVDNEDDSEVSTSIEIR